MRDFRHFGEHLYPGESTIRAPVAGTTESKLLIRSPASETPDSATPLAGKTIWLTRPQAQVAALQAALEARGARVVALPLLDITPLSPSEATRQKLLNLDQYDLVFYVSTNAATIGLDAIGQWWPQYPAHLRNFAVGPGTAAVLAERGLGVGYPREGSSSEDLMALPELQSIAGNKALIVRGEGGREVIAAALAARGARVDYAELYQRSLPAYRNDWLVERVRNDYPDAIVISSLEAMDNLKQLLAPLWPQWRQLPLVVSSARLAEHAHAIGFIRTSLIGGASDAAIIAGLPGITGTSPHE